MFISDALVQRLCCLKKTAREHQHAPVCELYMLHTGQCSLLLYIICGRLLLEDKVSCLFWGVIKMRATQSYLLMGSCECFLFSSSKDVSLCCCTSHLKKTKEKNPTDKPKPMMLDSCHDFWNSKWFSPFNNLSEEYLIV